MPRRVIRDTTTSTKLFFGSGRNHKYRVADKLARTSRDGTVFHSKIEKERYEFLKFLEARQQIEELELQPRFPIVVEGVHIAVYVADFRYLVNHDDGRQDRIVEDVKGVRTTDYKLKKKLVEVLHGITIIEIREAEACAFRQWTNLLIASKIPKRRKPKP